MRTGITSLALTVALMAAPALGHAQTYQAQVYQPPPAGYGQPQPVYVQPPPQQQPPRTEERVHVGLIVSGAVLLGVSWLIHGLVVSPFAGCNISLFGSSSGCGYEWESFRWAGLVPLLGPWIQLGLKPNDLSQDGWGPYLIIDGLLQAGGLTMLILGATITETVTVYGDNESGGPRIELGAVPGGLRLSGVF